MSCKGQTQNSGLAASFDTKNKWSPCCVCCKLVSSLDTSTHSKQDTLCGKHCAKVFFRFTTFLQGFLLGRLLTLLENHPAVNLKFVHTPVHEPEVKFEPEPREAYTSLKRCANTEPYLSGFHHAPPKSTQSTDEHVMHGDTWAVASSEDRSPVSESRYFKATKHPSCQKTIKDDGQFADSFGTRIRRPKGKELVAAVASSLSKSQHLHTSGRNQEVANRGKTTCFQCGIELLSAKALRVHMKRKHQKNIKQCRICGKSCSGQVGLTLHMYSRHKGEKANECRVCSERFPYAADLDRHMTMVHGQERGICHICGKHFRYGHTLKAHIRAHSGVRGFVCELCGKGFLRYNNLLTHKNTVHFCKVCKKKLTSAQCSTHPRSTVREMMKKHKSAPAETLNVLHCRECNITLESVELFEAHRREHKLQHHRPHHCQICGKRFKTSAGLSAHAQQHKEKRFECDLCQKTFTYKCNMETHRKTHVEGRPFECEFCNKTFKTEIVLQRHKAAHIEQRQFKCHICGKGLTRLDTYKRHLLKMHPGAENVHRN